MDKAGLVAVARACIAANVPRLVIVSSGSVSKPLSPVYVFLNLFGGIMRAKIEGEDAVRSLYFKRDGLDYVVVRPGGLTEDEPRGVGAIELNQGDDKSGRISRADVAAICVEAAIGANGCVGNSTFECYWADSAKGLDAVGFSNMMGGTNVGRGLRERDGAEGKHVERDLRRAENPTRRACRSRASVPACEEYDGDKSKSQNIIPISSSRRRPPSQPPPAPPSRPGRDRLRPRRRLRLRRRRR